MKTLCILLCLASPVFAADGDTAAATVPALVDAGAGSAAPAPIVLPDPVAAPADSASLVYKLYKAGHLVPMFVVAAFFLLLLLQKWIAWLRTGRRKVAVAAVLGGLAMLAERAAAGVTPNISMIAGAFGVALALWVKTDGEPKEP